MTYASDLGLKVGSKIVIVNCPIEQSSPLYKEGDILELLSDDGSDCPMFRNLNARHMGYFTICNRNDEITWEHYKEENIMLERNKEYDVKLTGEDIALLKGILGNCNGSYVTSMWFKFSDLMGKDVTLSMDAIKLNSIGQEISEYLNGVFPPKETEDQRKLRELKEKHAELGKAIEAMEKK